jgi:hypothetical protein
VGGNRSIDFLLRVFETLVDCFLGFRASCNETFFHFFFVRRLYKHEVAGQSRVIDFLGSLHINVKHTNFPCGESIFDLVRMGTVAVSMDFKVLEELPLRHFFLELVHGYKVIVHAVDFPVPRLARCA